MPIGCCSRWKTTKIANSYVDRHHQGGLDTAAGEYLTTLPTLKQDVIAGRVQAQGCLSLDQY